MSTTAELLRELRDRGWTQLEIAERTGIPQPRLSKWASDDGTRSADDALRIQALHSEVVAVKRRRTKAAA